MVTNAGKDSTVVTIDTDKCMLCYKQRKTEIDKKSSKS